VQAGAAEGTSRRGFVGGAAATATGLAFGRLPAAGAAPRCAGRAPGVRRTAIAPAGRSVWTADTGAATITRHAARDLRAGRSIEVGDAPTGIAIRGRRALVSHGFEEDAAGLALVDLRAGKVLARLTPGIAPAAVAFLPGGRSGLVVAGGERGVLRRVDLHTQSLDGSVRLGRHPRGLAVTADGRRALVALNGDAAVAVVDLRDMRVERRIETAPFPYLIAAAGDTAFVSHNGYGDRAVSRLDLGTGRARTAFRAGAEPAGLAFTGAHTLLVAARGDGTIGVHDARTGRRHRRIQTGGRPRALAVHGRRVFAADEETGELWASGV
jgi:DNA-binding beta-propeller fold protein YncE